MEKISLQQELQANSYPGRGIVIGRSADGKKAVTAYFIMGRSENSRNRIFVEDGEGIRTQAFDPSKLHLKRRKSFRIRSWRGSPLYHSGITESVTSSSKDRIKK